MPIYEYLCARCGQFEVTQRITEQPLKRCPKCRGKVQKLISATSFQLRGSGWYLTDYARAGDGKAKREETGKGAESSAGGETTESKPTKSKVADKAAA